MSISAKAKQHADSCRFCWMCRHICPIGNADCQERNTARARALMVSLVSRNAASLKDIADNVYECTLCGACTNNCKTGWDPKIFIQETKTDLILEGVAPSYVLGLLDKYLKNGTIYDTDPSSLYGKDDSKTLLLLGENAVYNDLDACKKAYDLLTKGGLNVSLNKDADKDGYTLWYLTGKTEETVNAAKACAGVLNKYDTVVVYNPIVLSMILHQWKEWGVEVKANVVSYHDAVKKLVDDKKLAIKKSNNVYTLQDNYAYARELDDVNTARTLISLVGENKEMLLNQKEANFAGSLIMYQYMPNKILEVANKRWENAVNMGCKTLVTENPDEHVLLQKTAPVGYNVITIEEMILANI